MARTNLWSIDKWLGVEAGSRLPGTVARVKELTFHPAFTLKNPNKVYALLGSFGANQVNFHAADGSGYSFMSEQILALDPINPQLAARMARNFERWKRFEPKRRVLMKNGFGAGGSGSRIIERNHRSGDQVAFLIYPHSLGSRWILLTRVSLLPKSAASPGRKRWRFFFEIEHVTNYKYANTVTFDTHRAMFLPRPAAQGRLLDWSAKTSLASKIRWVSDSLSNNVTVIELQ